MEPRIEVRSAHILSAAQASQYPPEAATSSTKACTGMSFSSARRRMRAAISEDCAGLPPGELMASATAAGLPLRKARSTAGATALSLSPAPRGLAMMTPCRRTTATSGSALRNGMKRFMQRDVELPLERNKAWGAELPKTVAPVLLDPIQ